MFLRHLAIFLMVVSGGAVAQTPIDPARQSLWAKHAFTCPATPKWAAFPARAPANGDQCDDGDETLFHGLMCAAGMLEGCAAVKASQATNGRWYRSPRRMAMAQVICSDPAASEEDKKKWCQNSFSPDMALGVQLYAHTTGDAAAVGRWAEWIELNRPCLVDVPGGCVKGLPRFCTDDTEGGCTLRPGDYATLAMSLEALGLVKFGDPNACPAGTTTALKLGDIFLKGLCTFRAKAVDVLLADSLLNKPGYSQHLVGVGGLVLRKSKQSDPRIATAMGFLNQKQPKNPFFAYMAGAPGATVRDMTLALCPVSEEAIPQKPDDWAWQREDSAEAWKNSVLWDCLFMASLLK